MDGVFVGGAGAGGTVADGKIVGVMRLSGRVVDGAGGPIVDVMSAPSRASGGSVVGVMRLNFVPFVICGCRWRGVVDGVVWLVSDCR